MENVQSYVWPTRIVLTLAIVRFLVFFVRRLIMSTIFKSTNMFNLIGDDTTTLYYINCLLLSIVIAIFFRLMIKRKSRLFMILGLSASALNVYPLLASIFTHLIKIDKFFEFMYGIKYPLTSEIFDWLDFVISCSLLTILLVIVRQLSQVLLVKYMSKSNGDGIDEQYVKLNNILSICGKKSSLKFHGFQFRIGIPVGAENDQHLHLQNLPRCRVKLMLKLKSNFQSKFKF